MNRLHREAAAQRCRDRATHGKRGTPEYSIWIGMHRRCSDPSRDSYSRYGGRGIKVCERWNNFGNFFADMGPRPSPQHTLDRYPNNDGNYEPGNCRWATPIEQHNNRRSNRIVIYRGKSMSLASALREAGNVVQKSTARLRLVKHGWSVEKAVETPSLQPRRDAA